MANKESSPVLNLNSSDHSSSISIEAMLNQMPRVSIQVGMDLYQWEGVWLDRLIIQGTCYFRSHFEARDDDVVLASSLKTGTTWLKALCSCIMRCPPPPPGQKKEEGGGDDEDGGGEDDDVLVKNNPHACVRTLEGEHYMGNPCPDFSGMPSPRLLHTHLPYALVPDTIKNSNCKIVYITRNPKDTFVALWHHLKTMFESNNLEPFPMDQLFDGFCEGVTLYGPFFDHVLQYWKESLKMPERILFLKYEDLKRDPKGEVKRLGLFLGKPLDTDEEIDTVLSRCSIERLKNLEVNKTGPSVWPRMPNSVFFRDGVVGGWKKYLTVEMEDRLDQITREKLEGTGLDFYV